MAFLLAGSLLGLIPLNAQAQGATTSFPIVLTVSPSGAPQATFTLSGCGVSPTTIVGDGSAHTFGALSNCVITITAPSPGSDTRDVFSSVTGGAQSSTTITSGSSSLFSLSYYYQVGMSVSYNVNGGGSPSANPSLWYTYLGTSRTAQTVTTTPTSVWSDYGTVWDFVQTTTSPPGSTSERWAANGALSGTATAGGTISLTLYHQFLQTLSYSVSNGGSPSAPTATGTQFGSSYVVTLTHTPEGIWFDATASIALRTPILDLSNTQYTPSVTSIQATQSRTSNVVYGPVIAATNTTTSSSSSSSSTTSPGPVGGGLPWWVWPALLGVIGAVAVGGFLGYRLVRRPGEKPKGPGAVPSEGGTAGTGGPGAGPGGGPGSGPGGRPGAGPGGTPIGGTPEPPPPFLLHGTEEGCALSSSWLHHSLQMGVLPMGTKEAPNKFTTPPDEPVPLKAGANDFHLLVQECSCPGIAGDLSRKSISMAAKLRIDWEIVQGEGGFVDESRGTPQQSDRCEEVLFQPARIDPRTGSKARTVKVRVKALHDDPTKPPDHAEVTSFITMEITRRTIPAAAGQASKDEYLYNYWVEDGPPVKGPNPPPDMTADCVPGHTWAQAEEIEGRINKMPQTCNPGDLVRLGAIGTDADNLQLVCTPSGKVCKLPSKTSSSALIDPLTYSWKADKGDFPLRELDEKLHGKDTGTGGWEGGQVVVWRAPDEACTARITLQMRDSGAEFPDKPKEVYAEIKVGRPVAGQPVAAPPPPTPVESNQPVTCCGPDVTDNVLRCMVKLLQDFSSWVDVRKKRQLELLTRVLPDYVPDFEKDKVVRVGWLQLMSAWDIEELTTDSIGGTFEGTFFRFRETCMRPDEPCYPSVAFLGHCHRPGVVNYVMWGVLTRLDEWFSYQQKGRKYAVTYDESTLGWAQAVRSSPWNPVTGDPNYQDQVAMASVGWQLAGDFLKTTDFGKLPYQLDQVDKQALKTVLEAKQNKFRDTAACLKRCPGDAILQRAEFTYIWGPKPAGTK
ncbi:MAG: hypothetical protein OK452_10475 [Thaumarchaeota archaeon]|nr:hypothetical protein [Nitrososphaerota archaeon]